MRRVSHGNLAISLFSALVVWNVCMVCESQADDASKRPTCNLYVPAQAKAQIIIPSESSVFEKRNITENDFVREKKIPSLTSVDIYPTYVALFECEPGYTLIGNTRSSCIQGQNGTAVLVGNHPTCGNVDVFQTFRIAHFNFRSYSQRLMSATGLALKTIMSSSASKSSCFLLGRVDSRTERN